MELNKILASVAEYAALEKSKALILAREPSTDLAEVRRRLDITEECDKLLYVYGAGKVEAFPDVEEVLGRAMKGSTLSFKELLD
ncbi:MAG: hypothetical protein K2I29_05600, partial [Clostridia bacterium]|nr:hypothetical protein [Clostridia bacterium]